MEDKKDSVNRRDLDLLAEQHETEEKVEFLRDILDEPRPLKVNLPEGGVFPQSKAWLDRLYDGDRMVREKKPGVIDHLRSAGPWMVSVDDEPLSVLDGMSQTATLCAGFAEDRVVRAYYEGHFGDALMSSRDTSLESDPAARKYADVLRSILPGLDHVSFVNSGAEANEKALALARTQVVSPEAKRVLAFRGSFHGRTLLPLHATWNPKKREPYEFRGFEAEFAPLPGCDFRLVEQVMGDESFLRAVAEGRLDAIETMGMEDDPLFAAELESLKMVHEHLGSGAFFVCIVEPMQSEGGESYISGRFARALRLLTRYHGIPLIFDEVQTGFGLGGPFFWHQRFKLVDKEGKPELPDAVTCSKRAQVGICISRFPDPEPTCVDAVSLVRGRIHAEMVLSSQHSETVESLLRKGMAGLQERFPDLVANPRATGHAFAFDLPDPDCLKAFVAQRFWRGAVVFGSGTRTARYRLSDAYGAREIELLFSIISSSLEWISEHPGEQPPSWVDFGPGVSESRTPVEIRIRELSGPESLDFFPSILGLERRTYEPARRDPEDRLRLALTDPEGIACIAEVLVDGTWEYAGYVLGAPLEHFGEIDGPRDDPHRGQGDTLYSIALTVDQRFRGLGLGRMLKKRQLELARNRKTSDGGRRYLYSTGRNRVGLADTMTHLNRSFGAFSVEVMDGQYGENSAQALYYRIPLGNPPPKFCGSTEKGPLEDFRHGIARPFYEPPASLKKALDEGVLFGPAVNKLTLCNYVTPAIVRAVEWVTALTPNFPHFYLCSSRDEAFDKTLKLMRTHRPDAQTALGLEGGYVGHTSAAARSLTDPGVHCSGPGYFPFIRIPHPSLVDEGVALEALRGAIDGAGGPEKILALFVEVVQERTGQALQQSGAQALSSFCKAVDIPIVAVESASGYYRTGHGPFAAEALGLAHEAMIWWGGGHVGFVHVSARYFVSTPLTMVSTWDGDELSLIRHHHQLREARKMNIREKIQAFDRAFDPARSAGLTVLGLGLYRVLQAGDRAGEIEAQLRNRGIDVQPGPGARLIFAPPLDVELDSIHNLASVMSEVV